MEVGVAEVANGGAFRTLNNEEVDRHIIAISEQD